jgi:hypothetical protein
MEVVRSSLMIFSIFGWNDVFERPLAQYLRIRSSLFTQSREQIRLTQEGETHHFQFVRWGPRWTKMVVRIVA